MVSEAVISTFLVASITGTGLVLAIYALITPISTKIFAGRKERLDKLLEEFENEKSKISTNSTKTDYKRLNSLGNEIKEYKNFPKYLGFSIIMSFLFFTVEIFLDWLQLVIPPANPKVFQSQASRS